MSKSKFYVIEVKDFGRCYGHTEVFLACEQHFSEYKPKQKQVITSHLALVKKHQYCMVCIANKGV